MNESLKIELPKTDSKNYIGQIKELLRTHDFVEKKPEVIFSVTTPSTILFCSLQDIKCLYIQDVIMIVGAITAVGVYFAVKSAIKKVDAERSENVLNLHEGIREAHLNKKSKYK